jgi:DNA-binding CsgD family transcriptional regulator
VTGAAPAVIGRADELNTVRAVVDAAVHGAASALLISGEAGVGKTSLVRTVSDAVETIWASCLPLTSLAVPLLPLRSALRPYCRWRQAEAALRERTTRSEGIDALREAHRLAIDLHAMPILTQLEALARGARVSLAAPAAGPAAGTAGNIPGLTGREREILGYLVAGRTYSEIARALVLSEKTVSVHVSNMLRKTGTASRAELAQLANRLQARI